MAAGLKALIEHRDQLDELRGAIGTDPALVSSAVEEILRWATVTMHFRRTATCDVELSGRAIAAGSMTLGDLFQYIFLTGLMAAPIVQIASIGTQITEAFAGLDRIREILDTPREDADDDTRDVLPDLVGDVRFEHVWFEYNAGVPVLKDVSFTAPAGTTLDEAERITNIEGLFNQRATN